MGDIYIRMVVFVVTMLFLVFSGVLAVALKFMFKDIDTLIDNEMYSVTSYEKFVKKWKEYIVVNDNCIEGFDNILYLKCEKGDLKASIYVTRNLKKYGPIKRIQEIVTMYVMKGNSLRSGDSKLWCSTRFMSYKWFVMDKIMMKYFGR